MKKFFCRLLHCCEPASDITLAEAGARIRKVITANDAFFIEGTIAFVVPHYRVLVNRSNGSTIGVSGETSLKDAVDTVIAEYRRQTV